MCWHLDTLRDVFLKLSRISGKWLLLEAVLVKWHPSELFGETKAYCELEKFSPSRVAFLPLDLRVVSELSYVFVLHGVNMSLIPSLVSFLPSHVNIILQLVSTLLKERGRLVFLPASLCFLLKNFLPPDRKSVV